MNLKYSFERSSFVTSEENKVPYVCDIKAHMCVIDGYDLEKLTLEQRISSH
jgi:hypothetical protein